MLNPRLDLSAIYPAVTVSLSAWLEEQGYLHSCRRCGSYGRTNSTHLVELDQRQVLASGPRWSDQRPRRRSHRWFCSATTILDIIRSARGCDCAWREAPVMGTPFREG